MSRFRLAAALLALTLGFCAAAIATPFDETPATPLAPAPEETLPPLRPLIPVPETPAPLKPGDAFGAEVTLPPRTIVYLQGEGKWENALDTLVDSFKSLDDYLGKRGIKPNGPPMTIYMQTSDTGFKFRAAVPVAAAPEEAPKGDIAVGQAPAGRALKFVHRGTYAAMDATYEAITDYLDDKGLDARDVFVEEYVSGPLQADDRPMVVEVYVPVQ